MSPPCIVLHYIMVAILRVELSLLHLPLTSRGKGSHAILRLGTRSPANSHIEAHSQELDNDSCNHVHYDRLPTRCLNGCSSTVRSILHYGGSSWNRTTEVPSLFTHPELVGNRTHAPLHLRPILKHTLPTIFHSELTSVVALNLTFLYVLQYGARDTHSG